MDDRKLSRRREILAAAGRAFDAHGYAATTMEAVADEAGVSKGSLYNYFESKHDLFAQVVVGTVAGSEAEAGEVIGQSQPASEKLAALLDYWFRRLGDFQRIGRLVMEFWATAAREQREGQLSVVFRESYGATLRLIGALLAEGVSAGEFRANLDTAVATSLIRAMLDGVMMQLILGTGVRLDEPFLTAMKQSILAALTAPPGRGASGGSGDSDDESNR